MHNNNIKKTPGNYAVSGALRGVPAVGVCGRPDGAGARGSRPPSKKEDCGRKIRPQKSDEPLDRRVPISYICSEQMFK